MIGGSQHVGQFDEEIGAEVEHLARCQVDGLSRERLSGSMISFFRQALRLCRARQGLSRDALGWRRPRTESSKLRRLYRSLLGAGRTTVSQRSASTRPAESAVMKH
jgi:hypothetical protein